MCARFGIISLSTDAVFSIYSEKGVDVTVPENTSTISEAAISLGEDMTVYCLRLQNMRC